MSLSSSIARFIATGAYTGYAPKVPGTVGTVPGVLLALALAPLLVLSPAAYVAALVIAIGLAIWSAHRLAGDLGVRDPSIVVVDEVVGYLLAVAFLPTQIPILVAAFVGFRFFDIVKPPPIRQAEQLPGGLGIVADDLLAGLLTNLAVRLLIWVGLV